MIHSSSAAEIVVTKVNEHGSTVVSDHLAVEEPLEISLVYGKSSNRQKKNISITMRTPGNDMELATGFLFTEGIIQSAHDIAQVGSNGSSANSIEVELKEDILVDLKKIERHFYTSSSCGVCGKSSIDAVRTVVAQNFSDTSCSISAPTLLQLPTSLRLQQEIFESTGGLHASALFDENGTMEIVREDVGRHNALDKLIGAALVSGKVPLLNGILHLSGRASFELVQKAAMAGIPIIAAVGSPSSLAVSLAEEFNITLIGFLRDNRFNIYTGKSRIVI